MDTKDGIIAGHGRLLAARKLRLKHVPVVVVDHLSETQKRAYVLADNRLAELAGWDDELPRGELSELRDADFNVEIRKIGVAKSIQDCVGHRSVRKLARSVFVFIVFIGNRRFIFVADCADRMRSPQRARFVGAASESSSPALLPDSHGATPLSVFGHIHT